MAFRHSLYAEYYKGKKQQSKSKQREVRDEGEQQALPKGEMHTQSLNFHQKKTRSILCSFLIDMLQIL